jgi:DNA helicase HerA-like ATPase
LIDIAQTDSQTIALDLAYANRHGLVTGATGTGKTVTLQRLAEQFSLAGVPVFAADIKGDLSGIAVPGNDAGKAADRAKALGRQFTPTQCPVAFWDIFARTGTAIRTSVHDMGPQMLASMLSLNPTQAGALEIAFRRAKDSGDLFLTLDDLRWALNEMLELREETCKQYGHITASSIAAIQRNILALEAQGGAALFGEPPFEILDFLRTENDKGVINLLDADQLIECPKLYAMFLLWLLSELFRALPEAGDLDKPKLVFFFDEAHLLFRDAPKPLLQSIERLVRLVRSKGVGVFFVTQSPADIPDAVLAQLGNRIQHALRAYTPKDRRLIKAAADAFRPNRNVDVKAAITEMGIGEALISLMEADGIPAKVERVKIIPPGSQIGPIDAMTRDTLRKGSGLPEKYKTDLEPAEAYSQFLNRQRVAAGLEPLAKSGTWKEGDYADHIPDIRPVAEKPIRARFSDLATAALCGAGAIAVFYFVGI